MQPASVLVLAGGLFLSSLLASFSAVVAQPVTPVPVLDPKAPVQNPMTPPMSLMELEKLIGGRTMLELSLKNATAEETTAALAKSSGLRFVPPSEAAGLTLVNIGVRGTRGGGATEAPRYDGIVPRMEFWPAVRLWSRAEATRLKSEGEAARRRLEAEMPTAPRGEASQPPSPEAQQTYRVQMEEWQRRNSQVMQRYGFNRGVSVGFDTNSQAWSLNSANNIVDGRALNTWPCFILATGYQRNQNLSIQENEPPAKATENTPNQNGTEITAGGQLRDGLSLNLSVFLDPKLLVHAQARVLINEAGDDTGEDLLAEREKSGAAGSSPGMNVNAPGGFSSALMRRVELLPRQSKGKALAVLRGVVLIRYPMHMQEHEVTDFSGPQDFGIGSTLLPASARIEPPRLENGQLVVSTSLTLASDRGHRAILNNHMRSRHSGEGILGTYLLPDPNHFTFTDTQGRIWRSNGGGGSAGLTGPTGQVVPITSPPTVPPDHFTYNEKRLAYLALARSGPAGSLGNSADTRISPEELAKVSFAKAVFTTASDWRTVAVPFEFLDLPLPPR